jgi:hypothetical protein
MLFLIDKQYYSRIGSTPAGSTFLSSKEAKSLETTDFRAFLFLKKAKAATFCSFSCMWSGLNDSS